MFAPPPTPRDTPLVDNPTWREVARSYAVIAAIPVVLWVAANPLYGTIGLVAAALAKTAVSRLAELAACLSDCGGFAFDLGTTARVTVTQPPDDACC